MGKACIVEKKNSYRILTINLKERDHFEDIGIGETVNTKIYLNEMEYEDS